MNEEMKIRRYESAVKDYPRKASERIIKLEHNWNELKKWLEEGCKDNTELITFRLAICRVLDKIKELEEGGNNE